MRRVNPLPNDKSLEESEFKAFADENFKMMHFFLNRTENVVEEGKNDGYQQKLSFPVSFKVGVD